MASEVELIISFIFKRSGKTELTSSELYLPLSMELKWFTPSQAKEFVNNAIKQKLLIKKGDLLKPSFDYSKVDLPLNYSPKGQIHVEVSKKQEQKKVSILDKILKKLSRESKISEEKLLTKIKEISQKKNISIEVAALMLSRKHNVDYTDFLDDVEKTIFNPS